jgi:hypothetical protein
MRACQSYARDLSRIGMCIGPAYGGTGHHQPDTHNGCVLVGIVAIDGQQVRIGFLAGPTSGRPWERRQTHDSDRHRVRVRAR